MFSLALCSSINLDGEDLCIDPVHQAGPGSLVVGFHISSRSRQVQEEGALDPCKPLLPSPDNLAILNQEQAVILSSQQEPARSKIVIIDV